MRLSAVGMAAALVCGAGARADVLHATYSVSLIGLPIGPCRSPVSDLPPEKEPQMRAALRTAGLLPAIS